jgi:hypothetical protein
LRQRELALSGRHPIPVFISQYFGSETVCVPLVPSQ